ncbi:unnamed protein product [Sphagnum jensenii]|uniref:Uncharacterized protein n=1 Tax=Sphagnum jensenii TaxID=128206 RepID=A0ABP1AFH1_9BRYO
MKSVGVTASQKQNSHRREIAKKGKILRSKERLKEWVKEPAKQEAKEVGNWEKSRNGKPVQRGSSSCKSTRDQTPVRSASSDRRQKAIDREWRSAPFRTDKKRSIESGVRRLLEQMKCEHDNAGPSVSSASHG